MMRKLRANVVQHRTVCFHTLRLCVCVCVCVIEENCIYRHKKSEPSKQSVKLTRFRFDSSKHLHVYKTIKESRFPCYCCCWHSERTARSAMRVNASKIISSMLHISLSTRELSLQPNCAVKTIFVFCCCFAQCNYCLMCVTFAFFLLPSILILYYMQLSVVSLSIRGLFCPAVLTTSLYKLFPPHLL